MISMTQTPLSSRKAFTLIKILVAVGIFTVVIIAFITMFVTVTRVQVQQSSAAEVNQQSQFVLQELQYYIEGSSLVDMPTDTATTTLKLWPTASSSSPTYITLSGGTLYLQQGGGSLQPLTSNKITISNLSFIKHSNPPGHDSVDISFTLAYNTSNIQQAFSELLTTSVARVSAATFDTGVYPSVSGEPMGTAASLWSPINGVIYFNNSNVGIGAASPQQALQVNGGLRILPNGVSQPACAAAARGTLWYIVNGSSNDSLQLCVKNSTSTYQWVTIY